MLLSSICCMNKTEQAFCVALKQFAPLRAKSIKAWNRKRGHDAAERSHHSHGAPQDLTAQTTPPPHQSLGSSSLSPSLSPLPFFNPSHTLFLWTPLISFSISHSLILHSFPLFQIFCILLSLHPNFLHPFLFTYSVPLSFSICPYRLPFPLFLSSSLIFHCLVFKSCWIMILNCVFVCVFCRTAQLQRLSL